MQSLKNNIRLRVFNVYIVKFLNKIFTYERRWNLILNVDLIMNY